MTIVRADKSKGNFTQVVNTVIMDLDYKELGMLTFLLSVPNDWEWSEEKILKAKPNVGRDATRNIIKNLKKKGYIKIKKDGLNWRWVITENPYIEVTDNTVIEVTENTDVQNVTVNFQDVDSKTRTPQSPHFTHTEKESNTLKEIKKPKCAKERKLEPKATLEAKEVLAYLNEKIGGRFRDIENIQARFNEDAELTIGECKAMIDYKAREWGNDSQMRQYLRPITLFSKTKFHGYVVASKDSCENITNRKAESIISSTYSKKRVRIVS